VSGQVTRQQARIGVIAPAAGESHDDVERLSLVEVFISSAR
jgi:hypothetical protein